MSLFLLFHPRLKVASRVDFVSGLLFAGMGVLTLFLARDYANGTAARMGPGYYPKVLAMVLLVLGAAIALRAVKRVGPAAREVAWRPLLLIVGSVVAFALLLDKLGLVAAGLALVVLARLGGADWRRWREVLVLAVVLLTGAALAFGYGLSIPFKLLPWST